MTEESQNEKGHIDLDKYEGHDTDKRMKLLFRDNLLHIGNELSDADYHLLADAPLLLEEVKRLRGLLMKGSGDYTTSYMDLRGIIEDVHWELTGDDHESNEKRIKYALIALRDVIG